MNKQCPRCNLNNTNNAKSCVKCLFKFQEVSTITVNNNAKKLLFAVILKRAVICLLVCLTAIAGFYFSLVFSAEPLIAEEQKTVGKAIAVLKEKGFTDEVFYLEHLTVFRGNDNWLNASVPKESAYAATNYPFEIMTIYPDFFTYLYDDTERAAILLHEAKHLQGFNEDVAYEFVWKNKKQLGWTKENYTKSVAWKEIRKQTREYAPKLFACDFNEFDDCSE